MPAEIFALFTASIADLKRNPAATVVGGGEAVAIVMAVIRHPSACPPRLMKR